MKKSQKPFEYDELFAMCYMCVAEYAIISMDPKLVNARKTRLLIEKRMKEIIDIRWDSPDKKEIK